ncbi:hypothetical protein ABTX62_36715 [Streptomyces sp. NPDC096046]|uniref:hypothetical protein n=1 Tax=Streptomyces sp. NPDC096046 TaxID=3155542 RepID=UPI00332190DA
MRGGAAAVGDFADEWVGADEQAAGRSGQVLGVLLIVLDWILLLRGAFGGLWLALIGDYIMVAAKAERQQASLAVPLRGL